MTAKKRALATEKNNKKSPSVSRFGDNEGNNLLHG